MDVDWQFFKWQNGTLSLIGAGRFYSNNEYDEGKASVLGIGVGTAFRLSTKTTDSFAVKTLSGTLTSMDEDLKVKGIDVMGGFVFEL